MLCGLPNSFGSMLLRLTKVRFHRDLFSEIVFDSALWTAKIFWQGTSCCELKFAFHRVLSCKIVFDSALWTAKIFWQGTSCCELKFAVHKAFMVSLFLLLILPWCLLPKRVPSPFQPRKRVIIPFQT